MKPFQLYKKNGKLIVLAFGKKIFSMRIHPRRVFAEACVKTYHERKQGIARKGVVYTCIINNYDTLVKHAYLDPAWDYVCFTDDAELLAMGQYSAWQIRPLQFTNSNLTLVNRWHKTMPHILFPEYEQSFYLDGNINILGSFIFDMADKTKRFFLAQTHFKRDCVFQEAEAVLHYKKENPEKIARMIDFLRQENMPEHYGLTENCVLYRTHHHPDCVDLMEQWWHFISTRSQRDQMSLAYLLWKKNIPIQDITFPHHRYDNKRIHVPWHHTSKSKSYLDA